MLEKIPSPDIVLDKEVLSEFFNFYLHKVGDKNIQINLFKYLKPFIATVGQIEEVIENKTTPQLLQPILATNTLWSIHIPSNSPTQFTQNKFEKNIMDEMIEKSNYKLMLVFNKSSFPTEHRCIDINSSSVSLAYTERVDAKTDRKSTQKYFAKLMSNATSIQICDKYICKEDTIRQLGSYAVDNNISNICIMVEKTSITDKFKQLAKNFKLNWKVVDYTNIHDRYILIDEKLKILLSSGCEYLFSKDKELHYTLILEDPTQYKI